MTILVMPQILESWQPCQNMLCGWQMSCSKNKIGLFWANLDGVFTLKGHMRSSWKISFFFMQQATPALIFSKSVWLIMHNYHLVLRGKFSPNVDIVSKRYLLLNLGSSIGQHMELPPKTSNTNLTDNPTCLEFGVFICYFGPHGSGHHPTLVGTFHPCRLPPSGLQTPLEC